MKKFVQSKFGKVIQHSFNEKYLFFTNITISGMTSAFGDFLEQRLEILSGELKQWSFYRTRNMSVSGMTVGGICHHWYKFLDAKFPGTAAATVIKKVLLDQILCTPVYVTVMFLTWGLLERQSKEKVVEEMREKFVTLYLADWAIWPSAQFVNFYFVPPKLRIVYDNSVSLAYDTFTSHIKHKPSQKEKP